MAGKGSNDISCPIVRASQRRTGFQDRWGRCFGWRGGWTRRWDGWTHRRRRWGWFNQRDLVEILFQSGFPEKVRLVITNSFKTRTSTMRLKGRNSLDDEVIMVAVAVIVVAVADSVAGRGDVDDEQSGFPETIRVSITNSFKTRTLWFWFRTFWVRLE